MTVRRQAHRLQTNATGPATCLLPLAGCPYDPALNLAGTVGNRLSATTYLLTRPPEPPRIRASTSARVTRL